MKLVDLFGYSVHFVVRGSNFFSVVQPGKYIIMPLWLPLLVIGVPTAKLWWRDRLMPRPTECCQECGYNLTGNVSGRCPECGNPVPKWHDATDGASTDRP